MKTKNWQSMAVPSVDVSERSGDNCLPLDGSALFAVDMSAFYHLCLLLILKQAPKIYKGCLRITLIVNQKADTKNAR